MINPFSGKLPEAAKEFAATGWDRLYPLAWSLTGHRADAEDLVQQSLITVLTRWERIERAEVPEAYVRRILVNHFLDRRRRRSSSEIAVAEPPEQESGSDVASRVSDRADLMARLARLDARQRAVLVLRFFEDLPDEAIADLLETSVGNVRVIAHRGLATLRREAGESGARTVGTVGTARR